ncbi:G patch domain-containing protein 4 [Halocaridina rubra]|uniref:G patch domain-containing protein 4 n=1 Tax=Halocaridina rubra TaxID=373956 RepID=A0AAN8WXB7_HALRR
MSNFGRSMLEKFGWQEGKGLGREESGITKAIKVAGNFNSYGLGHDVGREFTDQWWDKLYNATASNITVDTSEDGGVQVIRKGGTPDSKKIIPYAKSDTNQYSKFVKGGTITDHQKGKYEDKSRLSFDDIFKKCGGKTAHKGARHGLKMTAKLARVEQQECELLEKWQSPRNGSVMYVEEENLSKSKITDEINSENPKRKKSKKTCDIHCNEESEVGTTRNEKSNIKVKKIRDVDSEHDLEKPVYQASECHNEYEEMNADLLTLKRDKKKKKRPREGDVYNEDYALENPLTKAVMMKKQKKRHKNRKKENDGISQEILEAERKKNKVQTFCDNDDALVDTTLESKFPKKKKKIKAAKKRIMMA